MNLNSVNSEWKLRPRSVKEKETCSKNRRRSISSFDLSLKATHDVENIYRQDKAALDSFRPSSLETIYESPKGKNLNSRNFMGVTKLRRQCRFSPFYNPSKIKIRLRKNKSKNLKRIGVKVPSCSVTIEEVKSMLECLSENKNEDSQLSKVSGTYELNNYPCKATDNLVCVMSRSQFSGTTDMEVDNEPDVANKPKFSTSLSNSSKPESLQTAYEENFNSLDISPLKMKIPKSTRLRRRSGKVRPLCLNNSPSKADLFHEESTLLLKEEILQTKLSYSPDLVHSSQDSRNEPAYVEEINRSPSIPAPVVEPNLPSLNSFSSVAVDYNLNPGNSEILWSNNDLPMRESSILRERKSTKRARRVSGIHHSLYKQDSEMVLPESGDSNEKTPDLLHVLSQEQLDEYIFSPTQFELPILHSPESLPKEKGKKVRRRSARLSFGSDSALGSFWAQNGSFSKLLDDKQDFIDASENLAPVSKELPAEKTANPLISSQESTSLQALRAPSCTQVPSNTDDLPDYQNTNFDENMACFFNKSPILTGIFECKARLDKNQKFIFGKGSKLNVDHFIKKKTRCYCK